LPSFYRFRSVNALFDKWNELDKQEIFFSAPEALNDPVESFKDLFWRGDHIVWRNLFRHYLLCLLKTIFTAVLLGKDYEPDIPKGLILAGKADLPDAPIRTMYERICTEFFASHDIGEFPSLIADCDYAFCSDDLEFILRAVHATAFDLIFKAFRDEKTLPPAGSPPTLDPGLVKQTIDSLRSALTAIATKNDEIDPKTLRIAFSVAGHLFKQQILLN
jgi:hypothetical protein